MLDYEIVFFLGLLAIIFILAKQLHTSKKMQEEVSELRNALDSQTVYLRYLALYARHSSDLTEDEKSAFDFNMSIELQCVGLSPEQAHRLDEEEREAWKERNELLKNGFYTKK